MAVSPLQIPGYARQPDADFSSLAQLPQIYQKAQAEQMRRQTLADLGQGGNIDPMKLIASGDTTLANLGMQHMAKQEQAKRDERDFAFRQQESQRAQGNADRSYGLQAQTAARTNRSPEETASQRAAVASQYGIQPGTQEFKAFVLNGELPTKTTASGVEQRQAEATKAGLTPDNPGYQSFILTGKMPREDAQPLTATDKKAILEADEMVQVNTAAIDALKQAKTLSKEAFTGPLAGQRGYAASFLGESSDIGKAGAATTDLNNLVTSNALGQLKAIFGGAPTEGERKILLDIQGSANQPDAVRQKIYDRAIALADKRLEFNRKRSDELRGGQFYKPPGSMTRAPVQQTQGITQQQYNALPSGTPFTAPDGTQRVKP